MPTFIAVTAAKNNPHYAKQFIATSYIISFGIADDPGGDAQAWVETVRDLVFVRETPEQVMHLIRKAAERAAREGDRA